MTDSAHHAPHRGSLARTLPSPQPSRTENGRAETFKGIPGIASQSELEEHIVRHGPFSEGENRKIYQKWFTRSRPRDILFKYLDARLKLTAGTLADVGCGFGMNLVYCSSGSYGIDFTTYEASFAKAIGLKVYECNFLTEDMSSFPKVDVVWCAATLEHIDAPHVLLRRLYYLLKENGRIVIETPRAIPNRLMRSLPLISSVYGEHGDHVNSFSETSLVGFCEMAGFEEEWSFRYSTPLVMRHFPVSVTGLFPFSLVAQSVVFIGRRIEGWNYPSKATRNAVDNAQGYEFKRSKVRV